MNIIFKQLKFIIVIVTVAFLCAGITASYAQNGVRIAATTGTADASAMLDVVSSTKGFLVPRLSLTGPALTNPAPVTSPADGLLIYNLGLSGIAAKGLYYWDATTTAWRQLSSGALSGGGTLNYVAKWTSPTAIGNSQIYDNGVNVGIGTTGVPAKLNIQGPAYVQQAATWPDYDSDLNTNSFISYRSDAGGNASISTAGTGPTDIMYLAGNYYDSRAIITIPGSGGAAPADQGTGRGKDIMLLGGKSDNNNGLLGGRVLLQGGSGYNGGYGTNYGSVTLQSLGGNVGVATTSPNSTLDIGGTSNSAFIQNMAAWGLNTRTQGIMIIPEGSVSDNGSGAITFGSTVIVMSPLSGTWIRVAAGTYTLGLWDALYIDMPPTGTVRGTITPSIRTWADSDRNYDGRDRIVLAQRSGSGPVYFNFNIPQTALNGPGAVVQMKAIQSRTTATYTASASGNGSQITPLDIVITPRKAGNAMVLQWVVNGELDHDDVYIVLRDGVQLANTTNGSNNRWAGTASHPYENGDNNSTISNVVVSIIDFSTLATATTYSVWVRSSNGTAHTFYLNRCVGSTGQDSYENTLSTGTATEIQQ